MAATPAIKKLDIKSRGIMYEVPENIQYTIAPHRMNLYMDYSARIYKILLKYISSDDIHVYSIDETFLDVIAYIHLYNNTPKEIARMILDDIFDATGITATVEIGTNLYLTKIALDITAKHTKDNMDYLSEDLYRQMLWNHRHLQTFG